MPRIRFRLRRNGESFSADSPVNEISIKDADFEALSDYQLAFHEHRILKGQFDCSALDLRFFANDQPIDAFVKFQEAKTNVVDVVAPPMKQGELRYGSLSASASKKRKIVTSQDLWLNLYAAAKELKCLDLFTVSLNSDELLMSREDLQESHLSVTTEHRIWRWKSENIGWLRPFHSSFMVRPCYSTMYETIHHELEVLEQSLEPAVLIVTGTPGVGKTSFQIYLLLKLLHKQQNSHDPFVIVFDVHSQFIKFEKDCAPVFGDRHSSFRDDLFDSSSYYLFDADKNRSSHPLSPNIVKCRVIITTSPNKDHVSEYFHSSYLYMPSWSFLELNLCRLVWNISYTTPPTATEKVSLKEFKDAFDHWGGNARFTLEYSLRWKSEWDRAVDEITGAKLFSSIGGATVMMKDNSILVHRVLCVVASPCFKKARLEFASEHFRLAAFAAMIRSDADHLRIWASEPNGSPIVRAIAFEAYAHRRLQNGGSFQVRRLTQEGTCSWQDVEILPRSVAWSFSSLQDGLNQWLKEFQSHIKQSPSHNEQFVSKIYFRPLSPIHPVADSYIFPFTLLQMTTNPRHGMIAVRLEQQVDMILTCLEKADELVPVLDGLSWVDRASDEMSIVFVVPKDVADAGFPVQDMLTTTNTVHRRLPKVASIDQWVLSIDMNEHLRQSSFIQSIHQPITQSTSQSICQLTNPATHPAFTATM